MSTTTTAAATQQSDIVSLILSELNKNEKIDNSRVLAKKHQFQYEKDFVGAVLKLEALEYIKTTVNTEESVVLTDLSKACLAAGASPEIQYLNCISEQGILKSQIKDALKGAHADVEQIGFGIVMKNKWIKQEKKEKDFLLIRTAGKIDDEIFTQLQAFAANSSLSDADIKNLRGRKLLTVEKVKFYTIVKGPKFAVELKKEQADITSDMLANGSWKTETFKAYNFNAMGKKQRAGHLHTLLKVRTEFRNIFLEMGFEEMKTNNFVESSFWNFDTLFQPQSHPARDAHDTFFTSDPKESSTFPEDYLQKTKDIHEKGGYGSIGYRYNWKLEEAKKNILRTHTTAVSSRYLYQYAKDIKEKGFFPKKYFSIDRVFRNEMPDATHLCEFHQIEGMVIDKGLSLGDMIGLFSTFFAKIGITDLKFKPAYNPYTEPSMEIFGYHPQLQRWVEVGNSGVFRPEMLLPMGLPEDVVVLAWGLSLERPTMILYQYDNIRDLVGADVPIQNIEKNPIVRLDKKRPSSTSQ